MIARLAGKVAHVEEGLVVLDVGGVGFAVYVPLDLTVRIGDHVQLHTYLQVRETELTLYGFTEIDEKHLFELLLGVTGVGPKAALSLMSTLSSDTLRRAILNGQPEVLARAPGVGRKTGEAIVLHLRDKLKRYSGAEVQVTEDDADVIAALTALGFSIVEAQRALQQLPSEGALSLDEKIRQALTFLGR
jgi:holliday junction DNA helicase RuvA